MLMRDVTRKHIHQRRWVKAGVFACGVMLAAALAGCAAMAGSKGKAAEPMVSSSAETAALPAAPSPTPTPAPTPLVQTGLDILAAGNAARLEGRRLGVMALPTSQTRDGRPILDVLLANDRITVVALFAIQPDSFGIAHDLSTDTFEPRTGAPLYSLSAARPAPAADMLANLDAIVIDAPDSGARFNPSLSRVAAMMRECARRGVPVIVLDRPNPLGGLISDGPYPAPAALQSEWAPYPIPAVHGLTMGEMARLLSGHFGLNGRLEVVACEGWKRQWPYAKTELPWRAPAPEIASPEAALLYPGLALAALANVSVGLGTDHAYTVIGSPYMDSAALIAEFASRPVPGLAVEPTTFTPARDEAGLVLSLPSPPVPRGDGQPWAFAGEACRGVAFRVTNADEFQPYKFGIHTLHVLQKLYPDDLQLQRAIAAIGRREVMQMIEMGRALDQIYASWNRERLDFNTIRLDYLLY